MESSKNITHIVMIREPGRPHKGRAFVQKPKITQNSNHLIHTGQHFDKNMSDVLKKCGFHAPGDIEYYG